MIAWALEHPGCFSYGGTQAEALANLRSAIRDCIAWMATHTDAPWVVPVPVEFQVEEAWHVYTIDSDYEFPEEGYEVNAWFRHDWKLLFWSRVDLLAGVQA